MKKYFDWKNAVVLILVILFSIALIEVILRTIHPSLIPFGNFLPRYTVDGFPANTPTYITNHPYLPYALKPNFSHEIADLAWHPKPFSVTLDRFGYRNRVEKKTYESVLVGDSVGFGFGVDDDQTISHFLAEDGSVYNLSILGAGPAEYMRIIEDFLKRATTKRIEILFYTGNDFGDLENSTWDELKECGPPLRGKIARSKVSGWPGNPSPVFYYPLIRDLYLSSLIYRFIDGFLRRKDLDDIDLAKEFDLISQPALGDLDNYLNREKKIQANKPIALGYLQDIKNADCFDKSLIPLADEITENIKNDKTEGVFDLTRSLSLKLIEQNCYPVTHEGVNGVSYFNRYGGWFYEEIDSLKNGYNGSLINLVNFLRSLEKRPDYAENLKVAQLIRSLTDLKNFEEIKNRTSGVSNELKTKFKRDDLSNSCNKMEIFYKYLKSVENRGIPVFLFNVNAEKRMRDFSGLCQDAAKFGLKCTDLNPMILDKVVNEGNALYLDGSHFTVDGSKTVASLIKKFTN